ncbi:hypothetical protein LTR09_004674 [Extremus antarcticus]|uniref:Uncharacterized protein n=1 Tax=Extremus antarcticus TaxID=702011 RepID=A0AAJ0DHW2_9PEZI|nr:hypothetical protein LTR09_004674 [Extremus antarcticus]
MKLLLPTTAAVLFAVASNAYIVTLYTEPNCLGAAAERNAYDNTCALTGGFQSWRLSGHGGVYQRLQTYSRNACAGDTTGKFCTTGEASVALGDCQNTNGGSNALDSQSDFFDCA